MKSAMGKKWLAVVVIWSLVLAMTGWNLHMVNQVQSRRKELRTLKMDQHYIRANQDGIQEVHLQKARLTHPVKSFSLGFVVVESDLKRLSWDFGLQQLRIAADNNVQGARSVPISVFAVGAVPAMVGWIAAVEDDYPYLVIDQMNISYDNRKQVVQLQATFNYHYTLSDMEWSG